MTEVPTNSENLVENAFVNQEIICDFFIRIVKQWSPDLVLNEFKKLFINPIEAISPPQQALRKIVLSKDEEAFKYALKRSCYILLNNWIATRQYKPSQELIQVFTSVVSRYTSSLALRYLKSWLTNFIHSKDYEELKLFASRYENREKEHWSLRYTSYLLAPQYTDSKNSIEQRQAAKRLSKQLKEQFNFGLAMYTTHTQFAAFNRRKVQNPTALNDETLRLIKKVLAKRGSFSYANLANIFIQQTQQLKYDAFKQSLLKYLFFSANNSELAETLKTKLGMELQFLYQDFDKEELNSALLLKTCKRVIKYLTVDKNDKPSSLFVSLALQGKYLTLAILILKIILICPHARTYLDVCLAKLIHYYEGYSQEECYWVMNFLEVSKITLTIYTESIQYNLVNMEDENLKDQYKFEENAYCVFSRQRELDSN